VNLDLDIQQASKSRSLPTTDEFRVWVTAALAGRREEAELAIRLVDHAESRRLNHQYRGKDKSTNVLSFRSNLPAEVASPLLGDLVICAPVVLREAEEQGKTANAHWAHLVVHGVLHLLGYDHQNADEADAMESLEKEILSGMNLPDPYKETEA
jgi:probable rRNA maturation factor